MTKCHLAWQALQGGESGCSVHPLQSESFPPGPPVIHVHELNFGGGREAVMSPGQGWPLPSLPGAHLLIQFTGLFHNFPGCKMF